MEQLKQLIEWFDNTPFEDMPEKTQKEISDHLVELVKYKALGTLDDLTALVEVKKEGRLVELPVSRQSIVYCIETDEITTVLTCGADMDIAGEVTIYGIDDNDPISGVEYTFKKSDFGKTVFLTREAAESALSGQEGEKR